MLSNSTKRTIYKLYDAGLDPLDIAVTVALSPDTIANIIETYKESDDSSDLFDDDEPSYDIEEGFDPYSGSYSEDC